MKKACKVLLLALAAACAAGGLAACKSEGNKVHEHTSGAYSWNETEHWKTCDECGDKFDAGKHAFTDGVCACGYALIDEQGLIYEYDENAKSYTVTEFTNEPSVTEITVPETWQKRPVTKIGERVFSDSAIVKVSIPASIAEIGDNAFAVEDAVTSVSITDLKAWFEISFGDVFANPMRYGGALYLNGELVTDLTVPAGITQVKDNVFAGCESVRSLTVPEGVQSIGECAFYGCKNLETVTLPASLQTVDSAAFEMCGKLSSIGVAAGNANYRIDNNCLVETATGTLVRGCKDGAVPAGVTKIGGYAFSGCTEMTAFTVPETVTEIGEYAFSYTGLQSIVIPSKVTEIKACAFLVCSELATVQLREGLTAVGNFVFAYCGKLAEIALPETLKTIGRGAFEKTGLTEIIVPDSVEEIDGVAFRNCAALAKITFGNGLKRIGENAFEGCEQLKGVYITDLAAWCNTRFEGGRYSNPLWFAHHLYLNGTLVTELTIPASVNEIAVSAFEYCTSITSLVIESGVTKILGGAFEYCTNLQTVTLPASVTKLGITAFADCDKLEHIYFEGTRAQWDEIEKDGSWDSGSKAYTLHCSDDN